MALIVADGAVEADTVITEVVPMATLDHMVAPDGALGVHQVGCPGEDRGLAAEVDGEVGEADAVAVNGANSLAWMEKDSIWRH